MITLTFIYLQKTRDLKQVATYITNLKVITLLYLFSFT